MQKIKTIFLTLIFLGLFGLAECSEAADKYVRKGASGSGTSWTDAWGDLNNVSWTGLGGATLWIAAGTYTGSLPTISTADVTVKRATIAAHGTETGWSIAYDGQVTVNLSTNFLIINSGASGFTLDGASNNPWKFRVVGIKGFNGQLQMSGANNVTIRNIEFDGNSENPSGTNGPEDGLRWYGGSNAIIEYCYLHDYRQMGDEHMDAIQGPSATNITIRYNIFKNNGMHIFLGDCEWGSQYVNGIKIQHNVVYNDTGIGMGSYNTIVFKGTNQNGSYPTIIENNTFAVRSAEYGPRASVYDSAGCNNTTGRTFKNNIVYYSEPGTITSSTHINNLYYGVTAPTETGRVTSDPLFTNYAGGVFALQSGSPARDAGASLGYTVDILGTSIPQNGVPDIGAYEYAAAGGDTTAPGAPSGLSVI